MVLVFVFVSYLGDQRANVLSLFSPEEEDDNCGGEEQNNSHDCEDDAGCVVGVHFRVGGRG